MVLASSPVISYKRWAARPVGAARAMDFPIAFHKATIVPTVNDLPVPGPPVKIVIWE